MQRRRTGSGFPWKKVIRRTIALTLVGLTIWFLWLTADFRAVAETLGKLGTRAEVAVALLSAELGAPEESVLAGLSGWERLVVKQSAILMEGSETVAALAAQAPAEKTEEPVQEVEESEPADFGDMDVEDRLDPEDTAEVVTTTPPEAMTDLPTTTETPERHLSAEGVYLYNYTDYQVELAELAMPELRFEGEGPQILIIHTHTTESYTPAGEDLYLPTGDCRTVDQEHNMVRIGEEIAEELRAAGWAVVHDTQEYDYPDYNGAYTRSGASVKEWLKKYPSIRVVLDVHRDALIDADGTVYKTTTEAEGEKSAQVMLVVGSDSGGQNHPNWRENLALATAVQSGLNADYPNLARPMILRSSRFNQNLSTGALLVEVGSHGNTLRESLVAARCFARSLSVTLNALVGK